MHGHPWTNNKLEHYAIQFWHLHIIYSKAPFSSWKDRPYMYTLHGLVPKVILYRYSPASVTQKNRNVNIRPPAAHIWHRIGLWISVHCPNFYWPERNILRSPKCAACSPLQQNGIFVSASSTTNIFEWISTCSRGGQRWWNGTEIGWLGEQWNHQNGIKCGPEKDEGSNGPFLIPLFNTLKNILIYWSFSMLKVWQIGGNSILQGVTALVGVIHQNGTKWNKASTVCQLSSHSGKEQII